MFKLSITVGNDLILKMLIQQTCIGWITKIYFCFDQKTFHNVFQKTVSQIVMNHIFEVYEDQRRFDEVIFFLNRLSSKALFQH